MNAAESSSTTDIEFLRRFFGDGSSLKWDAYQSGAMPSASREYLRPWIEGFQNDIRPRLLPRVNEESQQTIWYAFADDARESRSLRDKLTAFIGPTYTDFNGQLANLSDVDPIDAVCRSRFGPFVFKLSVLRKTDRERVAGRLRLMQTLQERVPNRTAELQKPIGRLMRNLEMAIVVANEESAWTCYDALRARGRLSAHNLSFLQVRIHSAFERWRELLALPQKDDLLRIARPVRITEALVTALYSIHFRQFEETLDVAGAVAEFRHRKPGFGSLFQSRRSISNCESLKAFLLCAVSANPVKLSQAESIASEIECDADSKWSGALLEFARGDSISTPQPEPQGTPDELARIAFDDEDFDRAFALLLTCTPTVSVLRQVIESAIEIGTLDAARQAVSYFESAPDTETDKARQRRTTSRHLEELRERIASPADGSSPPAVTDWLAWFQLLEDSDNIGFAPEVARMGSAEWRVDELLAQPAVCRQLADCIIQTRHPVAAEIVRNSIPLLIGSFLPDGQAARAAKPVYRALTESLIYDDAIGTDDLEALEKLAEAILISAPSHAEGDFSHCVDVYRSAWAVRSSVVHLDWVLNGIDLLIDTGVPQHANVADLLATVANSMRSWPRRVPTAQWEMAEMLAADLNVSALLEGIRPVEPVTADSEKPLATRLQDKSIAIYSMTERIAKRARQLIERTFSGVTIHLCHGKASSDRLKSHARSADIFIVNTWDAQHAATNGIKANRAGDQITLEPDSKSASKLYEVLVRFTEMST